MVDFIVLGLPRSGTTWLANWLTTDRSLCLHDPFNVLPEHWSRDARRFGISCTGAYLMPSWLAQQRCPTAIIERDPYNCESSLAREGMHGSLRNHTRLLADVDGRRWRFDDLWNEDEAHELWAFLLPAIPFDALRYRLLKQMNVQPHQWQLNETVAHELHARGLLRSN